MEYMLGQIGADTSSEFGVGNFRQGSIILPVWFAFTAPDDPCVAL